MLNLDSLAQLKQLKADIRHQERRYEGLVSGSQNTFGFVRVDQGRQHFLPPLEMQKVFPGDRIEFLLKTDDKGREYAAVQKLITSDIKIFCGKCVQHGKAWFVDMDVARFNRKLFLPPPQRKGVKPGDWLRCQVSRHPIKEGKGQARVLQNLGREDAADFPSRYAAINFQLTTATCQAEDPSTTIDAALQQRPNRSALALVTIDPPGAHDIDDALYARPLEDGWQLSVAIADPGSVVALASGSGKAARQKAASSYLPHQQLPMLPPQFSENLLSLLVGQKRLAILCTLTVSAAGEVVDAGFEEVGICSRAQLSYEELDGYLERQTFPDSIDADTRSSLLALQQLCERMRQWRGEHQLLIEDKPEYRMQLDSAGRIEGFTATRKGIAHRIVEECMVATNQAAAAKLAGHGGIFSSHAGFRSDKLSDAEKLLREAGFENFSDADELNQLQHYRSALGYLSRHPDYSHSRKILSRFLQRSTLSSTSTPHLGMGATSYLNFTSPLRRYVDLYNHTQMKRLLGGEAPLPLEPELLPQLESGLAQIRSASYWAEQWLKCDYLERNPGPVLRGRVVQANPFGLVVRLDDSGIEGVLEKRTLPGKMKFSGARLRFGNDERNIGLDDVVRVEVSSIKRDKRQILFKWVDEPSSDAEPSSSSEPCNDAKPSSNAPLLEELGGARMPD